MIWTIHLLSVFFVGLFISPVYLYAQSSPLPVSGAKETDDSIATFASLPASRVGGPGNQAQPFPPIIDGIEGTDEVSPLFEDRRNLLRTRKSDEQLQQSWSDISKLPPAIQPRSESLQQALQAITKGAVGAFHRVTTESKPQLSITLEPAEFKLEERREITVTVILKNESSRQIQINFPTTQRIELLTKDKTGNVIERWSDDRVFDPLEGIVAVNPNETIEYSERIPTREMKSGEMYTIEASLSNNPQYTKTVSIHPQ